MLVMLVLIALVRNEMMVAFPLTADGTKWEPWTWMAGLAAAADPPRTRTSSPVPKMNRSVSRSCKPCARSGPAATSVSRSTPSHSRTEPPNASYVVVDGAW